MRRGWMLLAALAVTATACPGDPGPGSEPPSAEWTATRFARSEPGRPDPYVHLSAWTSNDWFATATVSGNFVTTLQFRARSGPGGGSFGAPQLVSSFLSAGTFVPGSDPDSGVVGVRGFRNGGPAVELLHEVGGQWSIAGSVALPHPAVAMDDRWLITRCDPLVDQHPATVTVYALDASGPNLVATPTQTLEPDPSWSESARRAFGATVALDGDLLVAATPVHLDDGPDLQPGAVRVFRSDGTTWAPTQTLDGAAAGRVRFGNELGVDDGPTVDRIVLGATAPQGGSEYGPTSVEIYADHGAGFVRERSLTPDPSAADVNAGASFGSALAIDGDLIALSTRIVPVASSVAGTLPGWGGEVAIFRHTSSGWTQEAEVATFVDPLPVDIGVMRPVELQIAGDHVAVTSFAPQQECGFEPCFDLSFEAWSLDRTG